MTSYVELEASQPAKCYTCGSEEGTSVCQSVTAALMAGAVSRLYLCSRCHDERKRILAQVDLIRRALAADVPSRFFFDTRTVALSAEQQRLHEKLSRLIRGESSAPWMFVTGQPGVGKTHLGCRVVVERLRARSTSARFVTACDFITRVTSAGFDDREKVVSRYADAAFLVIDDLGAEKPTQHSADTLFALIDRRYGANLPTVFTSNFTLTQIAGRLAGNDGGMQAHRLADRVVQLATEVHLAGTSFRRNASAPVEWSRYAELIAPVERENVGPVRLVQSRYDDDGHTVVKPWERDLAAFVFGQGGEFAE